jgi:hypothetical protein
MRRISLILILVAIPLAVAVATVIFRDASGNFERDAYNCERDARQSAFSNSADGITERIEFQKRCMTARGYSLETMKRLPDYANTGPHRGSDKTGKV